MTDAEKIAALRAALAPFADLLEYPADYPLEADTWEIQTADIAAAKQALRDTE